MSLDFQLIKLVGQLKELERYPLYEPFAYATIVQDEKTGDIMYYLEEITLDPTEQQVYKELVRIVMLELPPPEELTKIGDVKNYLLNELKKIVGRYRRLFRNVSTSSFAKFLYYMERDLLGYGPIDALMKDENIEDISCDGVGRPVYVFHRKYESIPTNIVPVTDQALDDLVVKLIHLSGRHVSVATPIVDAQLPDGSRIAVTYRKEVSPGGSTFTIRKFRKNPLTFTELVKFGNISAEIASYFWVMLDNGRSFLVLGVTGAGKTSFLNAMATFIRPHMKIITVEEVPEINLPHKNWIRLVTRQSYGSEKINEITLFDLVKATLRMRPDYLIVGEIRGEEAYVLFQAVNTGHSGISTMHAESFEAAVNRLMSPPMNIPPAYIPAMNIFVMIKRVKINGRLTRRVTEVGEVYIDGDKIRFNTVFKWNPKTDSHDSYVEKSVLIKQISDMTGKDVYEILKEIDTRASIVNWMVENEILNFEDVSTYVQTYYTNPDKILNQVLGKGDQG
ncbi:type II secretion system protein E [Vulcanisaeta moutnovskia 768-28]|uniref:Type II secretion system protein E n=1 Tax=Vulcanisaeta moutnovskia (strain 768-28) TaxID=985053 RepID=F0QVA3_VULM7|nr:type II/IV secretion system ATPase subunit [Vulcanisaeta moutnovskia]ADY02005.1 type II secretion system protein E [Vulcanisaeta moutnovskia 768-28]